MAIQSTNLMTMIHEKMNYLTQRQKLVSQNIANADTPKYRAQDLKPFSHSMSSVATSKKAVVATTHAGHLQAPQGAGMFKENKRAATYEITPDGNRVVIEQQMMKMNEINAEYKLATSLHKRYASMYRMAIRSQ